MIIDSFDPERIKASAQARVDYQPGNNELTFEVIAFDSDSRYSLEMNTAMTASIRPIGDLLREWRQRRRYSQLALAYDAEISPKHLSFVESGRAKPSREMLMHLAERLAVPLRERNVLLLSAGFAPVFAERPLDHQDLASVRQAVNLILRGHEPFPALALDRHWNMVAANSGVAPLLVEVATSLLEPPVNVLRLSLHPDGLAPSIANLAQWRAHLFSRLRQQIELSADPALISLLKELQGYPSPVGLDASYVGENDSRDVVVPFRLRTKGGMLSFISTTMVFGTPVDITSSELAIESFFPADSETASVLTRI